jgi:DNA-nicking Smr family endonuclease
MPKRHRTDDEHSGTSLSEQLRTVERQLRRARKRRQGAAAKIPPPSEAKTPPVPSDAELFREAAAGVAEIPAKQKRVPATPAHNEKERDRPKGTRTDFAADEHFDVRFSDLYIRGRAADVSRETVDKLSRGEFAVRSHVDLHGMAFDDAREVVDRFLIESQRRAERCVLVITGKGKNSPGQRAVLREKIPEWLARGPSARRVLAFVTARACDGGEGALYVLLRKTSTRKTRIDVEAGGGK